MRILGIESSCDETAAAVVDADKTIRSNVVWSQLKEHLPYGGVVPEIAARAHVSVIDRVIDQALKEADTSLSEIDLIAYTGGPGLIGGVIVGVMTAKGLALAAQKPMIAVNHLAGHALTVRLTDEIEFPYLLLLISGGHCQWLAVESATKYHLLGATLDDALGEAFDKSAKMMGLPYPGGPRIEQLAKRGDPNRFILPRPMTNTDSCDFSFSGLKTAVLHHLQALDGLTEQDSCNMAASFQHAAADCLSNRLQNAVKAYEVRGLRAKQFVVAGGVAANQFLRGRLEQQASALGYRLFTPPLKLCTDNAAMIAWAGYEWYKAGRQSGYEFEPLARWPLTWVEAA